MDDRDKAISFFKNAFKVDGIVEFVKQEEARELLKGASVNLVRLTDSRAGTFYIARVMPADKKEA